MLTGGSAGGVGTFHNLDWLSNEFKEKGKNKNVKVKGAPLAGWFWPVLFIYFLFFSIYSWEQKRFCFRT